MKSNSLLNQRASGILLHPTSLPGAFGSGDIGENAYRFIDWLKQTHQTYWQVLPLGEIGPGNSPYMSCSAFAGNILLIDLYELSSHGWLDEAGLLPLHDFSDEHVEFDSVISYRMEHLRRAANNFFAHNDASLRSEYEAFCTQENAWLNDYALFKTIEQRQNYCGWSHWPSELAQRNLEALNRVSVTCKTEIRFWKFCQWCFARQWAALKQYANQNDVSLIGDVPIFVAYQSADVWAHQELFELDDQGHATVVAGVPPDYFSATGQLWGNPLYRWQEHEQTGYAWWIARLRQALKSADIVRIDHFRGFSEYWEIPADATTAIHGQWMPGPGAKLFAALEQAFGDLPVIAEDLGLITPDVIALRDQFNLPGMRILQFAFGGDDSNLFLPHHYVPNTVAYTGTHDNDTTLGWWANASDHERHAACRYLGDDDNNICREALRVLAESSANTVIFPMQDILELGGEHRMNFPGQAKGNWAWRFTWQQLRENQTEMLLQLTTANGRA